MRKTLRILLGRVGFCGMLIALQALILIVVIWRFQEYFVYFYAFCVLLSVVVVMGILNNRLNPAYKIAWIIPIMLVPIFGGLFYILFSSDQTRKKFLNEMKPINEKMRECLIQDADITEKLKTLDKRAFNQSRYILDYAQGPIYENTTTEYLTPGEKKFERLLEELKKAKHYIFLEYFIIDEGMMWDTILEILKEKAAQGVDVRVVYDDFGCLFLLPSGYDKKLEAMGIKCCVFNPFVPFLTLRMNNRNHRKIAIIDGHTAFTGGINIGDEYINGYEKHGHWKDASIMIKGDAVWSFTVMFLTMWDFLRKTNEDYEPFRPHIHHKESFESDGFVQPFTDSPLDNESVGETVYLNLINSAKDYVYINTPYLILDNEMITALSQAAKRGVDVRIVTPHIGDKWFVHAVTRANYAFLIEDGVKIYEYTPGFIHSKTFVVDGEYAVVGTINLDYRSLYLHYECGAWLYKNSSIKTIYDDYVETLKVCQLITLQDCHNIKWYKKFMYAFLRIFAPLM
ncbi:cardiolipin synthase [Turicibacter sanguinis]|uniref:cardiolipin synthase n=1 Tax=Turicibacter sanguinis TaxID=154288 RepID=UPI00399A9B27